MNKYTLLVRSRDNRKYIKLPGFDRLVFEGFIETEKKIIIHHTNVCRLIINLEAKTIHKKTNTKPSTYQITSRKKNKLSCSSSCSCSCSSCFCFPFLNDLLFEHKTPIPSLASPSVSN